LVVFPPFAAGPDDLDPLHLDRLDPPVARVDVRHYPGHAGAPRRPGVTFRALADEVADGLAEAGEAADVVGVGMGAYIVAELLLHRPERVRSAVVIGSPLGPVPDEWRDRDRELGRSAEGGMAPLVEPTLLRWFTPWAVETGHAGVETARRRLHDLDPAAWNDFWVAIAERSVLDDAAAVAVQVPVTVVAPLHDPSPNPRRLRELARALPLSRLMYVDGPHMLHAERPENVLAAVDSHLAWAAALPRPVRDLYWVGE
jgi:pimeloyl-ACP methyl ester carboxylesterase